MATSFDQVIRPAYNPVQPGVYSGVDASALQGIGRFPDAPIVAVVGTALGGVPLKALYFRGPGPLRQALRGGVAYDVARFAFAGGATRVCVVRVGNSPLQSSLALAGSGGTAVTLTSLDYGTWTTSIKATVAANNNLTISYTDALGVTYQEQYNLGAAGTVAQIVAAINGNQYGFNKSNYVSAVAGVGTAPLTVIAATPLAGGADGLTPIASDWTNGFQILEPEAISLLVPATGDTTIHAQAIAHANNMSNPLARRERTVVAGGILGESTTTVVARMTGVLQDKRFQLVYPGVQEFDVNGNLTSYDPLYAAGKVAGMHASLPDPAWSLVHRRFPCYDVERRLSTLQGSDVDQLLNAGITPFVPAPGSGFWIADSLSGYNLPDGIYRDAHKVRNADAVQQIFRQRLEDRFIGQKSLEGSANAIQAFSLGICRDLVSTRLIRAYQAPQVTPGPDPRTYNIVAPVMLVDAIKFITLVVALQPSSTVNRDVGTTSADSLT